MFLARAIAASRRRFDLDAADYFARIVAAGSTISEPNKAAVNAFVTGCKADGIWSAIKASCLLAGPDTLAGALVPLVGPAPTNVNFVAGDYNRVTGLVGNGTNKSLSLTLSGQAQDNCHQCIWMSSGATTGPSFETHISEWPASGTNGRTQISSNTNPSLFTRCRENTGSTINSTVINFVGISRSASANYLRRVGATSSTVTVNSNGTPSGAVVFANPANDQFSNARLSYYSIGESLDLAKLDARITTYMASIS
jgi:hypothetical protein